MRLTKHGTSTVADKTRRRKEDSLPRIRGRQGGYLAREKQLKQPSKLYPVNDDDLTMQIKFHCFEHQKPLRSTLNRSLITSPVTDDPDDLSS